MEEGVHIFESDMTGIKILYGGIITLITAMVVTGSIIHEKSTQDLISGGAIILINVIIFIIILKVGGYKLYLYPDRLEINRKTFGKRVIPYQSISGLDIEWRSVNGNMAMFIIFHIDNEKEVRLPYDTHKKDFNFISKYIKDKKGLLTDS